MNLIVALILGLFSKTLMASSLFFYKVKINVSQISKVAYKASSVLGLPGFTPALEKQNVDYMTEKLNILKRLPAAVTHEMLAKGRSEYTLQD